MHLENLGEEAPTRWWDAAIAGRKVRESIMIRISLVGIVFSTVVVGCAAGPGSQDPSTQSSGVQAASESKPRIDDNLYDAHSTSWTYSESDEGPIPYQMIDLHDDNHTYEATLFNDCDRREDKGVPPGSCKWLNGHKSKMKGTWEMTTTTVEDRKAPAIRFFEDSEWVFDLDSRAKEHTFVAEVREVQENSYRLCFQVNDAPCVVYDRYSSR